jgi:hypothetical protein
MWHFPDVHCCWHTSLPHICLELWKIGHLVSNQVCASTVFLLQIATTTNSPLKELGCQLHVLLIIRLSQWTICTTSQSLLCQAAAPPSKWQETKIETKPVRFELALPPINHDRTSWFILFCWNALLAVQEHLSVAEGSTAPFQAYPQDWLIVWHIVMHPVEPSEEWFELHIPAPVLLEHIVAAWQAGDANLVL